MKHKLKIPARGTSKLPAHWLKQIGEVCRGETSGDGIAVVRLLLTAAIAMPRHDATEVDTSIGALSEVMRLSKPMTRRALARAEAMGLIKFTRGGGRQLSKLQLINYSSAGEELRYAQVPNRPVVDDLFGLPRTGRNSLAAHKAYLELLARRPNGSRDTVVGHEKLRQATGIQAVEVRTAITLLANAGLLHVDRQQIEGSTGPYNRYRLRGEFFGISAS